MLFWHIPAAEQNLLAGLIVWAGVLGGGIFRLIQSYLISELVDSIILRVLSAKFMVLRSMDTEWCRSNVAGP